MTLVELLAAMAIFLGLAGMILQVLGGGLDLWNAGEKARGENERAAALLDRLSAELRHLVANDGGEGVPRVRLQCDTVTLDSDGDGTRDFRSQRLLFVRRLIEERAHPPLQRAGTWGSGDAPFLGAIDSPDARFQATEELVEEALVPQFDQRAGHEGRFILWRALKSPIGGADSLFALAAKDDGGLQGAALEPLAEHVLWFGIGLIDESVEEPSATPGDGKGPLVQWDSTRGVLPDGDGWSGFRHARGPASLRDADDDLFPTAIRLSVIMADPPGQGPEAEIAADLPATSGTAHVELVNGRYLRKLGATAKFVKVGHEWMEARESDGKSLEIVARGMWGTTPVVHLAGAKVLVGERYERTIPLPCGRQDLVARDLERRQK
jgi:type II secretory pathway pseudopilin PulG